MAKVIIAQHSPYEPLGIIVNTLKNNKVRVRYINFYRNPDSKLSIEGYDGLIVLGGSMNPLGSI